MTHPEQNPGLAPCPTTSLADRGGASAIIPRMRKEMGDGPELVWAIAEKLYKAVNRAAEHAPPFRLASCEDQQRFLGRANRCLGRG